MSEEPGQQMRVIITGRVHGVGFRQLVLTRAQRLGLRGYVCNLAAGQSVMGRRMEVVAEGSRRRLDDLLEAITIGPEAAAVLATEVDYGQFATVGDFEIRSDKE